MSTPLVKLEHINFYYNRGKPSEVRALKDINIEISRGGYAAFFGPSGCGKTTLIYLIGGIETENTESGNVLINGRDLRGLSKKELAVYRQIGVGIIFQQFNLLPSLSVLDNVALPMAFLGIDIDRRRKEAMKLLDRFGMTKYSGRYPSDLSGGQQQRVSIARALSNNPPLIIADEPLGNLDSENANKALEFLKELNEKDGRTIIMVTHESWSLRDAKTIFYLKDGEVLRMEEPKKKSGAQKSLSEYLYKQLHPEVPTESLMARSLASMFLRGFSASEIKRFELFLSERLKGKIDSPTFIEFLDRPFKEGGLGLWRQRAIKIAETIDDLIYSRKQIGDIYAELEHNPETPLYEEIAKVRRWLLTDYTGSLSATENIRLDEAVEDRLRNIISPEHFRQVLELSRKEFGVGLAAGTARTIAERLESVLAGKQYQVLH